MFFNYDSKWYVVHVRPKIEKKIAKLLEQNSIEVFLPLYKKIVLWSDRKKKILTPLFPGYVFVKVDRKQMEVVYGAPGFVKFLSTNGVKDVIPDKDIDILKGIVDKKVQFPENEFIEGQEVKVICGALKGIKGTFTAKNGSGKVYIKVHSINQALSIQIDTHNVESCSYN